VAVFLRRNFKMMDYTIFKELVNDKFMEYMPEEFKQGELRINKINKVNGSKDGLSIYMEGANGAPTIYVDDMYKSFKDSGSLEEAFQEAAEFYTRAMRAMPQVSFSGVTEDAQDKIYMQLINTESNRELLGEAPHREVNDTSVIYRIMVSADEHSMSSALITNRIAGQLGMSEEQLFKIATENTPKLLPSVAKPMTEVVLDMFLKDGMPRELAEKAVEELLCGGEMPMWVISNSKGSFGAVNMLFEKNLNELSKKLDDDLYILPSSIHEVIAVPAGMMIPEELAEMVNQVNGEVVDVSERLSNQVYHYDRAERKLSMATDSPNKGITNAVAEVGLVYDAEQKR
jgi:hypothetical protein